MEPAAEAKFNPNSYGFRPGRSCHDVQQGLFNNLSKQAKGKTKRILELDIEKCFDRIDHKFIMQSVQLPTAAKTGLYRALKAGVRGEFPSSELGTPQGGVISPLLANIALHGLENVGHELRYKVYKQGKEVDTIKWPTLLLHAGSHYLGRIPSNVKFEVEKVLDDGSDLSLIYLDSKLKKKGNIELYV